MSVDPDQIDLNSHLVGREKEVNVSEQIVAETLTDSPSQAQLGGQGADGVDGSGKNTKMESIEKASGAGSDIGPVEEEGCDKVRILRLARCSSMEAGGGTTVNGKGDEVSKLVEVGKAKKIQTSGEVANGISVKTSTAEVSSPRKDVGVSAGVDGEASFDQLVQDMELDSPDRKSRIRMKGSQSSEEMGTLSGSRSTSVDPGADHNMSMDGELSCDLEASSDASKPAFRISDLVWGKVMSYPWWPGQIFDPSHASEKAKKLSRKDAHLVAYFGDDSFAWNKEAKIKLFSYHFSRMEKQTNSAEFQNAVDCALEEVSRRTELSLCCSCSSKVETEMVVNPGTKEEATEGVSGDSFSSGLLFKPLQLIEFVRALAPSPCYDMVDKLRFVTSHAQLLAFHHWKGYPELPQFEIMRGTLEGFAGIPPSEEGEPSKEVNGGSVPSAPPGDEMPSEDCVTGSKGAYPGKQKDVSGGKKEKSLSELIAEAKQKLRNGKKGPNGKPGIKSKSVSPAEKRKGSESAEDDSTPKRKKSSSPSSADDPPQSKQTFRVGASILRVASQLTCASSVLRNGDGMATKSAVKNKTQSKKET